MSLSAAEGGKAALKSDFEKSNGTERVLLQHIVDTMWKRGCQNPQIHHGLALNDANETERND